MEWLLSIIAAFLGALLGNWFALGRDLRKERNDARYPIWKWLDAHGSGLGENLPSDQDQLKEALQKYKSVVRAREWKRYLHHINAIREIREPFAPKNYNATVGKYTRDRDPTRDELVLIAKHWRRIVHLTRHRKFM